MKVYWLKQTCFFSSIFPNQQDELEGNLLLFEADILFSRISV